MKNNKKVISEKLKIIPNNITVTVEQNPDFVNMINLKGFTVEIHKERVEELTKQGFQLL